MMMSRQGFIRVVAVAAVLACWAGTALAQPFHALSQRLGPLKTERTELALSERRSNALGLGRIADDHDDRRV